MTQQSKKLKKLFATDLSSLFDDAILFRECIPALAKMIGVAEFSKKMGMTKTQYYARTNHPEKWSLEELIKAAGIFKQLNVGK
ncbi:MAG: hypothetical protein AAF620_13355 [Bacteroidota bacterium]